VSFQKRDDGDTVGLTNISLIEQPHPAVRPKKFY